MANGSYDYGASGIYVKNGANLTINNSTLQNNISEMYAGAIKAVGAKSIVINNTIIKNNFAKNSGSAIGAENTEVVLIQKTVISDNTGTNAGTVHIKKCGEFVFDKDSIVKNNKAGEAGGISITDTDATIAGTIEGNEATKSDGNGGGLYTFLEDSTKTVTIIETAVIKNNIAGGAGGGIYVNGPKVNAEIGKVVMDGGMITGNTAKGTPAAGTLKDGGGAGAYIARGFMEINGGTIKDNTSTSGIGDGILVSHAGGNTEAGKLEITDGIIEGSIVLAEEKGEIGITGGTFETDISDYLPKNDNIKLEKDEDGNFIVVKYYTITVIESENGKVTASAEKAAKGEKVTLTVTPNEGYKLKTLVMESAAGSTPIDITETKEFEMIDFAAIVFAEFEKIEEPTTGEEGETEQQPTEEPKVEEDKKEEPKVEEKDETPKTGSIDVVLVASVIVAVISVAGIITVKKYTR